MLNKRKSLGIFSAKEKKQIDSELIEIEEKQTHIKKELINEKEKLEGFSTKEEIIQKAQTLEQKIEQCQLKIDDNIEKSNQYTSIFSEDEAIEEAEKNSRIRLAVVKAEPDLELLLRRKEIQFGNYQGETEWCILDEWEDNALIISKYGLNKMPYDRNVTNNNSFEIMPKPKCVTWENCSLRKWLNEDFLKNSFTATEYDLIQDCSVKADKNPLHETSPGNDTTDKVFLLSSTEANMYFASDIARSNMDTSWWLRTPGETCNRVAIVGRDGAIANEGCPAANCDNYCMVRPVMLIKMNKEILSTLKLGLC